MNIDFTGLEKRPEGLTDEMLNDDSVQSFLTDAIKEQKNTAVSQMQASLDETVRNKAIQDQKVADLKNQLKDIQKGKGSPDQQAQLAALQNTIDGLTADKTGLQSKLDESEVTAFVNRSISEYNQKNEALRILPGAEEYVIAAALGTFRKTAEGHILPFKGNEVLTGSAGSMTGTEFISAFRESKPIFFLQPAGGGAAGGKSGGAGIKEMTRAVFDALPPMEQGAAAKTHKII